MSEITNRIYGTGIRGHWHTAVDALRGFPKLMALRQDILAELRETAKKSERFNTSVSEQLNIKCEIAGDARNVPRTGPLLVISNHPDGGVFDTLAFLNLLEKLRPDYKILGGEDYLNSKWLITDRLLPVVNDNPNKNQRSVKNGLQHLLDGGCVGLFPEGVMPPTKAALNLSAEKYAWTPLPAKLVMGLHNKGLHPILLPIHIEMPPNGLALNFAHKLAFLLNNDKLKQTASIWRNLAISGSTIRMFINGPYRLHETSGHIKVQDLSNGSDVHALPKGRNAAQEGLLTFMRKKICKPGEFEKK